MGRWAVRDYPSDAMIRELMTRCLKKTPRHSSLVNRMSSSWFGEKLETSTAESILIDLRRNAPLHGGVILREMFLVVSTSLIAAVPLKTGN